MSDSPRVFVSHSHADKELATKLATVLRESGVDAWLDKWEIQPGDSLVQKIFEEGLKDCAAILVLLSPDSVTSSWVRHELDVAMVKRIEGSTRVVPVMVRPCEVPTALRALLWVDMSAGDVPDAAKRISDVVFKRNERPPIRNVPSKLVTRVPGLTEGAARIATHLSGALDAPSGFPGAFDGPELVAATGLDAEEVNDGVEELEGQGLVTVGRYLGTAPFGFGQVEPTYALGHQLRETGALPYDPERDVLQVGAAIGAAKYIEAHDLQQKVGLTPARINNAVAYLEDYDMVKVLRAIGSAPFVFLGVEATSGLRRFLAANAR